MKIDSHIHITPPDIIKNYKVISENEPYFKLLSETPHNRFSTYENVVSHLKKSNFDKGIVFGFGFQDIHLCKYVNDYTIEAVKNNPNELIGFMNIPANNKDIAYEIERCYNSGLKGIGEIFPEGQNLDLENLHKTDLKICCKKYNLPLLVHTNETVGHYYAGKTNISLKSIENFINNFDDIPIILAHFGGGILFYELMKEIKKSFSNIYYDTSASLFLYDSSIYNVVRELNIFDKLFFGSDYPLLPIPKYMNSLNSLTETERNHLLGLNIINFFKKYNINI